MTTQSQATTADAKRPTSIDAAAAERYREAERKLWSRYGLEPTERFVEIHEPPLRLRVTEVGEGDPVLFIPGTGGTGPYWAPLVRELQGFRCLMLDRPGWGLSSRVEYSGDTYRDDVAGITASVLDALAVKRASVVGASIGDVWATGLAQSRPDRVASIVLLGSGPMRQAIEPPRFLRLLATPLGALMVRIPESRGMVRSQLAGLGHEASLAAGRIPEEYLEWRSSFAKETRSMRNERRMVRAVLTGGRWARGLTFDDTDLSRIESPALMVVGTEDPIGSVQLWRQFVAALPHGEIAIMEGAGHLPWWDDPSGVGKRVRTFLESQHRS